MSEEKPPFIETQLHLPRGLMKYLERQAEENHCSLEEEIQRRLADSVINSINRASGKQRGDEHFSNSRENE